MEKQELVLDLGQYVLATRYQYSKILRKVFFSFLATVIGMLLVSITLNPDAEKIMAFKEKYKLVFVSCIILKGKGHFNKSLRVFYFIISTFNNS